MLISVTFSQLRQHLEHLDRELQLAEKIKDLLKQQYELAVAVSLADAEILSRQLTFADTEIQNIHARRRLLEYILDTFLAADQRMKEKISEARRLTNGH